MNDITWTPEELTGRTRRHVVQNQDLRVAAVPEALSAFLALRNAAATGGFDLQAISTFRDFDTQVRIWNQKFLGRRPLFDKSGAELTFIELSPSERIRAILSWSALRGASRHHWGTEFDVFDANCAGRSEVQLLPSEVEPGGRFHALHRWLDENSERFGFFRPYDIDRGGVLREPWHLSYRPISEHCLRLLSVDVIRDVLAVAEIEGKDALLTCLPEIYDKYVVNIADTFMQST